ncbi:LacI family transcriptional regulator [Cellulomonas sp. APG4]|uniref:LacI family DNA-binding transcriptional regulator n=1 Tax=Cellulomonas sp. APG4 TaxID=1538656 RepID=UPI00137A8C21|nr:LacI family DNA-binding transcriptional regulator [Cellulomonas sp. APG4]NCT91788.1 LacI family transcriptional regulator [Cellulomonas sp. APG4]
MAAGIEDVARAAGVSTATVSRALRGLPNVTPATRARVREVATALGYVASPSAASLASGRTRTIGLISPWINRWFFANVIEGAERTLRAQGFDVLLYTFDIRRRRGRPRVDPDVLRRRVDGVLIVGLPLEQDEMDALVGLDRPLVCVGWGGSGQVTVRLDDVAAGYEATAHLVGLGHRRIAHVTGAPGDVAPMSPPVGREAGWRAAMAEAGLAAGSDLEVPGNFDLAGGRDATSHLLEHVPDLTAIFAASDEMAMGAVLAVRRAGLRVPEDVSVIGIDGHDLAELAGLTTIAQDAGAQGARAAELVLEMIAGGAPDDETIAPTQLVERSSTGPPPGSRRLHVPRGA